MHPPSRYTGTVDFDGCGMHNPDQYMSDLRQLLSQGGKRSKRIGFLLGAGAPMAIKGSEGQPLIPDVEHLTRKALEGLSPESRKVIASLDAVLGGAPNIEMLLTRTRMLAQAIGPERVWGLTGDGYEALSQELCGQIGKIVDVSLPKEENPYTRLVEWISGTHRQHAIEIFTPNYDLLFEEAFERVNHPYFDGFMGAHRPFFDAASIAASDDLPVRWSRLWKMHGSLGWDTDNGGAVGKVVRTGQRQAAKLIYPDHLKFDEASRLPYSAIFERLRRFLGMEDSLLITCGFSFSDAHIVDVLRNAMRANSHTAVFAFQYRRLEQERAALELARHLPNCSVYAADAAMVNCVQGKWAPSEASGAEWSSVRATYWAARQVGEPPSFLLGDFTKLAEFVALAKSQEIGAGSHGDPAPAADAAHE